MGFGLATQPHTQEYVDAVSFYENPPNTYDDDTRRLMKASAKKWAGMLKKEYYDAGNAVGREALYAAVKRDGESSGDYPTKSFVRAWLHRQASRPSKAETRPAT